MRYGSFLYVSYLGEDEKVVNQYIEGIYNTILLKDVVTNMKEVEYYQVSASVLDERALEWELAPLQEIKDNYPKTLLNLDDIGNGANYESIKQINVINWLLSR